MYVKVINLATNPQNKCFTVDFVYLRPDGYHSQWSFVFTKVSFLPMMGTKQHPDFSQVLKSSIQKRLC